jgi:hypothetical protein
VLVVFITPPNKYLAIIRLKYYLTTFRNDERRCFTNKGIALLLFEVITNKPINKKFAMFLWPFYLPAVLEPLFFFALQSAHLGNELEHSLLTLSFNNQHTE